MIIKIFTGPLNYSVKDLYQKDKNEYIIGVDQGCKLLLDEKIDIDLAVGDFDSINEDYYKEVELNAEKTLLYPKKKDYTDTYLAIQEALKLKASEIQIYGGLGQRFDHTYANIMLLKKGNIKIIDNTSKIYVLSPGTYKIENKYKYISFFSIEDVERLSLIGFNYEVHDMPLEQDNPLCISNEGSGTVTFTKGTLLVIHQNE